MSRDIDMLALVKLSYMLENLSIPNYEGRWWCCIFFAPQTVPDHSLKQFSSDGRGYFTNLVTMFGCRQSAGKTVLKDAVSSETIR